MNRQTIKKIEAVCEWLLFGVSVVMASRGNWPAAQYFIMSAAFVEFEEWINRGDDK